MVVDSLTHQLTVSHERMCVGVGVGVDECRSSSNSDDIGGSSSGSYPLHIYVGC